MISVFLACASATLAGSTWSGSGAGAGPAALAAESAVVAAVGQPVPVPNLARACVEAFSKNICESHLSSEAPQIDGCLGTGCRTLFVPTAQWQIPLAMNRQNCLPCSGPGDCDETPKMDGTLEASIQYTLRLNGACPFRGCFEGRWQHVTQDGTVYQGRVTGTMGVGTHRFNAMCCETSTDRTCERCLDVEFIPNNDLTTGIWRIGVEGTFEGAAISSTTPPADHLHFSLSGDFYADGDVNGPFITDGYRWRFAGTADGVHIDYCN